MLYPSNPAVGSISIPGRDGGGILSKYASLRLENGVHRGWITCYRVVRGNCLDVEERILQAPFAYESEEY